MTRALQSRTADCLSDLVLDRLLARECSVEEETSAKAHIDGCQVCRGRLAEFSKDCEVFAAREPPLPVLSAMRPRRPAQSTRSAWAIASAVVSMAAGVVLFVRSRSSEGTDSSTRLKGSSHIGFYVKHGDNVSRGVPGQRVEPGDALRFVYSSPEPRYLAVLSVDAAGRASIYVPDAATATRVDRAVDVPLPSSTVLDATLGVEHLYGIFCLQPIELEPVRRALEATPERPPVADGCEIDTVDIRKDPPVAP